MSEDIADIGFRAQTDDLDRADDKLDKLGKTSKRTGKATDRLNKSFGMMPTRAGAAAKAVNVMTTGVQRLLRVAGAAAAALGSAFTLRKFIDGTTEADKMQRQMQATLQSTKSVAGQTISSLNAHAAALQKVTNYGDETTNGAQNLLLTFTKIQGDVFPRATEAVLDVATAMGTDLKSAAIQVGKALNDPAVGMTALSRSGITFSDAQKQIVKDLVAVGDMAGAQAIILKELETQFGGSARAARQTLGGALTSLANAWGDIFELGKSASEPLRQAIERLTTAVSNPAFVTFANTIGGVLFGALQAVVSVLTVVVNLISVMTDNVEYLQIGLIALIPLFTAAFGGSIVSMIARMVVTIGSGMVGAVRALTIAVAANPLGALVTAIAAVIGYFVVFRDEITVVQGDLATLGDYGRAVWQMIAEAVGTVTAFIGERFGQVQTWVSETFAKISEWAATTFSGVSGNVVSVGDVVKSVVNFVIASWVGAFNSIAAVWSKLPAAIGEAAYGAVNSTISAINFLIEKATVGVNKLIGALNNVPGVNIGEISTGSVGNIDNPFAGATSDLVNGVKSAVSDAFSTDYVGEAGSALSSLGESLRTRANEIAEVRAQVGDMKTGIDAAVPSIDGATEALNGAGGAAGGASKKVKDLADKTKEAAQATADFAKGVLKGAIDEVRSAMDDGKITVQEWTDVFLSALDRITDKLLDDVLDALFQVNNAGSAGGGGSWWKTAISAVGSLFGGGGGVTASAKGNAFDNGSVVKKFASGGVVHATTAFGMAGGGTGIMGEAGPEGILPLTRTRGGDLGVKQVGGDAGGVVVQIVDQRGTDAPAVREERQQMSDGRELRRYIISAVKEATASGELDSAQSSRFGHKPTKVVR